MEIAYSVVAQWEVLARGGGKGFLDGGLATSTEITRSATMLHRLRQAWAGS